MSEVKENKPNDLILTEEYLVDTKLDDALRRCAAEIKLGMVPKQFDSPGKLLGARLYLKAIGMAQSWLSKIYNVHGSWALYGESLLAAAQRDPSYGSKREYFLDKDGKVISPKDASLKEGVEVWCAVYEVKTKLDEDWNTYFFSRDDAKKAGLIKNVWLSYFKDMLMHKARARALKANYPLYLHGLECIEDLQTNWENGSFEKDVSPGLDKLRNIDDTV